MLLALSFFAVNLNKLKNNTQLFNLFIRNGLLYDILSTLVAKEVDFIKITVNDNKELLDFLLKNQLIAFDKDKLNFIKDYSLTSSLLKTGDLTIVDLQHKSIEEIQKKVDELSKNILTSNHKQLRLPETISKKIKLTCDNGVCSLQVAATGIIIKNIQKEKLPEPSLSQVETACAENSRYVIS